MEEESRELFYTGLFNQTINIDPNILKKNIDLDQLILEKLRNEVEGKCICHGFIKKGSISIVKRTIGTLNSVRLDGSIAFDISYSAQVCNPIVGQVINCEVININRMGILASQGPINIVIARSNTRNTEEFEGVEKGNLINVKIIGSRFDLYDTNITAIGSLE